MLDVKKRGSNQVRAHRPYTVHVARLLFWCYYFLPQTRIGSNLLFSYVLGPPVMIGGDLVKKACLM